MACLNCSTSRTANCKRLKWHQKLILLDIQSDKVIPQPWDVLMILTLYFVILYFMWLQRSCCYPLHCITNISSSPLQLVPHVNSVALFSYKLLSRKLVFFSICQICPIPDSQVASSRDRPTLRATLFSPFANTSFFHQSLHLCLVVQNLMKVWTHSQTAIFFPCYAF